MKYTQKQQQKQNHNNDSYYQLLHSLEFRLFNKAKLFEDNSKYIHEGKANWKYIKSLFKQVSSINKELKHQINCKPQIFQCLNIVLNPLTEKELFDGAIIYLQQYLYTDELKQMLKDLDKSYQKCYDSQKKYYEEKKKEKDEIKKDDVKKDEIKKDDNKKDETKKDDNKKDDNKKDEIKKDETKQTQPKKSRQYKKKIDLN